MHKSKTFDALSEDSTESFSYAREKAEDILRNLNTCHDGLSEDEAKKRLVLHGPNLIAKDREIPILLEFLSYFKSPLVIILLFASGISAAFGELRNAVIIWIMILLSVILDFTEEHSAGHAAKKLLDRVKLTTIVIRNGKPVTIPASHLVPGDILTLSAGNLVPADARILSADDCFVNQSSLTGESLPVEKNARTAPPQTRSISEMDNILFLGTSIVTGTTTAVVVRTGKNTELGRIASTLVKKEEKSEFEIGVVSFGYFTMKAVLFLVLAIFLLNSLINRNILESFMFAVAIAVGVTPELLPMIMSITMARGSMRMNKKGVIVKKPSAIPSFGSMNILCTDKTGTLTEDEIKLVMCTDASGERNETALLYAFLNSSFQTGIKNPLDQAVLEHRHSAVGNYHKTEEIPFDFHRKMLSVAVRKGNEHTLITKGAPEEVWKRCTHVREGEHVATFDGIAKTRTLEAYERMSADGYRVLAVAIKRIRDIKTEYTTKDETDLELLGYIAFLDPPKKGIKTVLKDMREIGVEIKIITGDNELVTQKICNEIELPVKGVLLGKDIESLTDDALHVKAMRTTIFARFSPDQKNRIISTLRAHGNVVGYMGDGINDAPSLKNADVGISVNNAVDVARESADLVLTRKSLKMLKEGILEGRKTFGNTMKYVLMGLSSNFGNMFSMLGAVFFLPFLPMLPVQILLNNLLYDGSQVTLPTDHVDDDWIKKPHRWNLKHIKNFMLTIGPVSSVFDIATFLILFFGFGLSASAFQTGWFMESLATQTLVIHVIRTRRIPFVQSKPSLPLLLSTLGMLALGWTIPFTPVGAYFRFSPPPLPVILSIVGIVILYLGCVEIAKRAFFKKHDFSFEKG